MAGLSLGVNGVVTGGNPMYGTVSAPATASEAAFGIGNNPSPKKWIWIGLLEWCCFDWPPCCNS